MLAEELRQLSMFDTFRPFRVFLKDGRTYDLPEPGFFVVLARHVIIGVPKQIHPYPILADRAEVLVEEIDRVEMLTGTDSSRTS